MIASMTAYGRGEVFADTERVTVELRGVNHRFKDIQCRLPRSYSAWVETIRKYVIDSGIHRGRVEVNVQIEEIPGQVSGPLINKALAMAYFSEFRKLAVALGLDETPKLSDLLSVREIYEVPDDVVDTERLWSNVKKALEIAMGAFLEMRRTEGETLARDLKERLANLANLLNRVEGHAPKVVEYYREKLLKRIEELVPENVFDEARFLQEVTIFADRSDITEETVRAKSHIDQFANVLKEGGVVGKKMEFLLQELHREINTIGSKSNDLTIANLVLEMKNELEKVREQVQNIE